MNKTQPQSSSANPHDNQSILFAVPAYTVKICVLSKSIKSFTLTKANVTLKHCQNHMYFRQTLDAEIKYTIYLSGCSKFNDDSH